MMKVFGMGRLTRDPEIRVTTETHKSVARFSVAVNRRNGETDFFNVVCWEGLADFAEKYLQKGTKVVLSGKLQTSSYEKNGTTFHSVEILADEIEFAEKKSN